MLWDTKIGVVLHIIKVRAYIHPLSYSDDGIILDADKGALTTVIFHYLEATS